MYGLRSALAEVAQEKGEWAGLPMPLDGERLVIHPSYPWAAALGKVGARAGDDDTHGYKVRNLFWSSWRRCEVAIFEEPDGSITKAYIPGTFNSMEKQLRTLGCADAWGIEQESKAVQLLGTLVTHRQFKQYMLTGSFLERSKRSGMTYLFRRLRPTVAIRTVPRRGELMTEIACTLCLHPIAYYADSWSGAMCPTDDVIAHLQLMRGDEALYWRRANQHPAHRPEAGL